MANPSVIWLFAAVLFFPALVSAQNSPSLTVAQRKDRAITAEMEVEGVELVALEKETAHAMALNNSSFFQRVYNDDFVGTTPTGEILDRSALVASIQNSTAKYSSFIATDIHVRVYGPTAVVTCTWTLPVVASSGASTLICVGLMNSTYAGLPSIMTETPCREVGSCPFTKSLVCQV